jgi:hypothetical protein
MVINIENKLTIKENKKIQGRYEIVALPGKHIIEINKKGYEMVRKEIDLIAGENKTNIELKKEKKFKIKVTALNYTNDAPVENVKLKVLNL